MAKISDVEWATLCFCSLTERQWEVCFDNLSKHLGVPYPPDVMINQMRGEIRLDSITDSSTVQGQKQLSPNSYFKNSRSLSNFQVDCSQATKNYISKHVLSGACSLAKLFMCSGITRQESPSQDRLHFPSHEEDSALLVVR